MGEFYYEKDIIHEPPEIYNNNDEYYPFEDGSGSYPESEEASIIEMQIMLGSIIICMIGIQSRGLFSYCYNEYKDRKKNRELKGYLITKDNNIDCSICLDTLKSGDKVIKLNCDHLFHKDCIKDWFRGKTEKNCPLCRNII